jgi:hypothetical protein
MIRWSLILIGAVLLPGAARAEDRGTKAQQAFAAICSAAIDEKPDIASIAASVEMEAAGGKDAAIAFGRTNLRVFNSSQSKQNIIIATTTFSDARQIECKSTAQTPATRTDLESLAQSMRLEGDFLQIAPLTTGKWKRPGNQPLVFVTVVGTASSSTLTMQRIDISAVGTEKK